MRIVLFYHSLLSDWNHGNAHFLRGVATELIDRGHDVQVFEPRDAWSLQNLFRDRGEAGGEEVIERFYQAYPLLRGRSTQYDPETLDLNEVLEGAGLVMVHEWSDHELVKRVGEHRHENAGYHLLFHDTHHRAVTERENMAKYDLRHYDGVLAFGNVIRDLYLKEGWTQRAWTWHEAADTRVFRPLPATQQQGDLVWIGNWGDDERTQELHEFLLRPAQELGLRARIYGVRYPKTALAALEKAGIEYCGWLPNFEAPQVFAQFGVTVHVPRRPYVQALPGIPTIRPFEALACRVPLVCAPWNDAEHLFTPGEDYLVAQDGEHMIAQLQTLLCDGERAHSVAESGRQTVVSRHTCAHRVDELLKIVLFELQS
jgi:spore maturation protein CgeB